MQKRAFKTDFLLFIIFGILIISFIATIGNQIYKGIQNPNYRNFEINYKENIKRNAEEKLDFYMKDAENWMQQLNYKNATYQYKNALEIDPKNVTLEKKYVEAVVFQCYFEKTNCELAKSLLQNATKKYPNDSIINDLRAFQYFVELYEYTKNLTNTQVLID